MWQKIGNYSAIAGLSGVSLFGFIDDAPKAHIALIAFVLTCAIIAAQAVSAIRKWQRTHYPKGYVPVATFLRYSTIDGKQVVHETFRQIQIKHAFLTKIDHRYFWTGSKPPTITSSLQKLGNTTKDPSTEYNVVEVAFPHARYFNDTEIVHLRSKMDDSDERSETFASLLIEYPTKLINFRVELLHCGKPSHASMVAYIERRLKGAMSAPYEQLATVTFDITSRCFEYLLPNPEPGFNYRIRWDRPRVQAPGRGKKRGAQAAA